MTEKKLSPFVQFPLITKLSTEWRARGAFRRAARTMTASRMPVRICRMIFVFVSGSISLQPNAIGYKEGALCSILPRYDADSSVIRSA